MNLAAARPDLVSGLVLLDPAIGLRGDRMREIADEIEARISAAVRAGHLPVQEPFGALFTQGMITRNGAKMSKSKGNVVSPREFVAKYGADTPRCYTLFMGPPEQGGDWTE